MIGQPHPLALFTLVAVTRDRQHFERAQEVIKLPENRHLLSNVALPGKPAQYGLDVGFNVPSTSGYTIATLGRQLGNNIIVEGQGISRTQCSFEVHPDSGAILLLDLSPRPKHRGTTEVVGPDATPFNYDPRRGRMVVISEGMNSFIKIGDDNAPIYFQLVWHARTFNVQDELRRRKSPSPRDASTLVNVAPTTYEPGDGIYQPNAGKHKMRFSKDVMLGAGSFGEVYKALDIDTGRIMAVKTIRSRPGGFSKEAIVYVKRELQAVESCTHRHIVEYIYAHADNQIIEIFTALKEGSVKDLTEQGAFAGKHSKELAMTLLHQMLQALDYLTYEKGLIHRDVKHNNILYTKLGHNKYQFELTDFGLCNHISSARTGNVGTNAFMAPELRKKGVQQTSKVDIWSLFVTVAYILDVAGYHGKSRKGLLDTPDQCLNAALEAASVPSMRSLSIMAKVDPNERPSAAQMLRDMWDGKGLVTPRSKIPPRITTQTALPIETVAMTTNALEQRQPVRVPTGGSGKKSGWFSKLVSNKDRTPSHIRDSGPMDISSF